MLGSIKKPSHGMTRMQTQASPSSRRIIAAARRYLTWVKADPILRNALLVAAVAIGFAIFCLDPSRSQAIAGWVQAVGSIAAIFIAIRIGQQQSEAALGSALEAQRQADLARQRSAIAIVHSAHDFAASVRDAFDARDPVIALLSVYDRKVVDNLVSALVALPLHDIGTVERVSAVLSMRLQFVLLGNAVDAFITGPWRHPELRVLLENAKKEEDELQKHKLDATHARKTIDDLVTSGRDVLKSNVFVHLKVIDADHHRIILSLS